MQRYILSLGSNIGDRMAHFTEAKKQIAREIGEIESQSSVYETAAWGKVDQASFYNQVIVGFTRLNATDLMSSILAIEAGMGREREGKWSPRVIDIDILFYGNEIIDQKGLNVPHPMFYHRKFNLIPLVEILPEFIDPRSAKSMITLLQELKDELEVRKIL
jgi:2-amino-4-hydroxy-6-hydroxymethyldihydropteridine diphosphokinase